MGTGGYSGGYYYISFDMWQSGINEAQNYSTIGWALYIVPDPAWYNAYYLDANAGSWSVSINGYNYSGNYNYDFRGGNDSAKLIAHADWSGHAVQYHNTDGSGSSSGSAGASDSLLGSASAGGSCGLTDFTRLPTTPGFQSGPTRSIRSVSATLSGVTNYGSGLNYYMDYATWNGSSWSSYSGQQANPARSFTFSNLSLGTTYRFRGYANDSEGTGGSVTSDVAIPNVPSAPASISVTPPAGRSVTITAGAAANNGAAITAYYAQQSSDNGVTWKNAAGTTNGSDTMSGQTITYSNLLGGATYKFRVYAANEMGSGAVTTSASTFVPSGGKRYNGSSFVNASTASRRNPTNTGWVPMTITKKYVNGQWTDFV